MPENTSPLAFVLGLLVLTAMTTILMVGTIVWYVVYYRWSRGEPILEHEPRRLASWGFIDGVALLIILAVLTNLFVWGAGLDIRAAEHDSPQFLYIIFASTLAQMAACFLTGLFIMIRTRCTVGDLGISIGEFGRDIKLGFFAFCALAMPTYGIQVVLTRFWPSEHPLIEAVKTQPALELLLIAGFVAVISAPLTEEFMFRTLFQGWLEKMFDPIAFQRPNFLKSLLLGERVRDEEPEPLMAEIVDNAEPLPMQPTPHIGTDPTNPYAPPSPTFEPPPSSTPLQPAFPRLVTDVLSITISSVVFALLHYSHGPDWVPLLFLAAGLGYIYRRTHRITPTIVVHFLLNGLSMMALFVHIFLQSPGAAGE
jgi:membrane protease YdiL (CAAX protease family)